MKYSVVTKFVAILLAACALVAMAGGAIGIALVESLNLYSIDPETWMDQELTDRAGHTANLLALAYAAQNFSNCSTELLDSLDPLYTFPYEAIGQRYGLDDSEWGFRIENENGTVLDSRSIGSTDSGHEYTFLISPAYPMEVAAPEDAEGKAFANSLGETVPPTDPTADEVHLAIDYYGQRHYYYYATTPVFSVTVTFSENIAASHGISTAVVRGLYAYRYAFIGFLVGGFLVFAMSIVYLCCAAGRSGEDPGVRPGGLNRLPLDLYALFDGLGCFFLMSLASWLLDSWVYYGEVLNWGAVILALSLAVIIAHLVVAFIFAVAAQCKAPSYYWWRHSIIGWSWGKLWALLRLIGKGIYKLFCLLPLIWQWLLVGAGLGFGLLFTTLLAVVHGAPFFLFADILIGIGVICYGAYSFGTILKGAKEMAEGNLNTKVSTKYLVGGFAQCAGHLNALADVATVAARKQLRSDRMKTELITNVSHDIKTPLTSIINYVDLLQSTEDPQARQQYLEVLSRQSQRMKKLIDDLMDMSKATTGNMPVEITRMDVVETVTQALGEFSDKLAEAELIPVFRQSAESIAMLADGRLTWRVLSNLLSNAVKYAMPGTRLYVDLMQAGSHVLISLKNISREALNISADELTERFVRGDASRNTEGSGLGLNIAKSLMELQRGSLELLVDGDLFKVTLCFPAA